jgi:hypothetical protein
LPQHTAAAPGILQPAEPDRFPVSTVDRSPPAGSGSLTETGWRYDELT